MIISHEKKFIYFAYGKCGSTSIENSLCDETYRINKNKLVKEYFNQNVIIDLTYETLNLYRILSGQ